MSTIPKEVSGSPLSSEQVQYLEGFFAGIKDRGLAFGDAEPSAGPRAKPERLTPEEVIKREKPPLDALSDLRAYLSERSPGESFQQFTTAREIETLASYLAA